MHIVLVTPEIPQNTGNIARTCAALGAPLHLVHPLGFSVDAKAVRRAGLDYWHLLAVHHHDSLDAFVESHADAQLVLFSSKGDTPYTEISYSPDAFLVFGSETRGLPEEFIRGASHTVARIPTVSEARCLNLSNAVAVAAYEVVRQHRFVGLETRRD
ncbi:MAG: tRNA (cytidine(34)-2'-O)-methyltransferase [Spirochaetota bacterium]